MQGGEGYDLNILIFMSLQEFLLNLQKQIKTAKEPIYFRIKVLPGSAKNEFIELMQGEESTLKIRIAAPPEKGKANKEIIKFFKKELGAQCEIISGTTEPIKLIKLAK